MVPIIATAIVYLITEILIFITGIGERFNITAVRYIVLLLLSLPTLNAVAVILSYSIYDKMSLISKIPIICSVEFLKLDTTTGLKIIKIILASAAIIGVLLNIIVRKDLVETRLYYAILLSVMAISVGDILDIKLPWISVNSLILVFILTNINITENINPILSVVLTITSLYITLYSAINIAKSIE